MRTTHPRLRPLAAAILLSFTAAIIVLVGRPKAASAAEQLVNRPMTLHQLVFAGDVGLGIGHARAYRGLFNNEYSATGVGMNLEGALGVTEKLELGFRTGLRFGDDGKVTHADEFGRTLWTETYGSIGGFDTVANPELRIRWVAYAGSVAEVGLDGRVFLPIEDNTRFGMMFGVPLHFHVSDFLRINTGPYIPLVFFSRTLSLITIPAYFWFQVTEKLWLGPMASLRFGLSPSGNNDTHLLLGFGLGYQVADAVDLKTWLLFPAVDNDVVRYFGAGFGVQFRIGE